MNISQTEKLMEIELNHISEIIKKENKVYADYCDYEDDVGTLIEEHCPFCQSVINSYGIGISILMANIRNYIRGKVDIQFVN